MRVLRPLLPSAPLLISDIEGDDDDDDAEVGGDRGGDEDCSSAISLLRMGASTTKKGKVEKEKAGAAACSNALLSRCICRMMRRAYGWREVTGMKMNCAACRHTNARANTHTHAYHIYTHAWHIHIIMYWRTQHIKVRTAPMGWGVLWGWELEQPRWGGVGWGGVGWGGVGWGGVGWGGVGWGVLWGWELEA